MLNHLKNLYSMSFNDSKRYIDYFFSNKYHPDNTIVFHDKEKLISMLFLISKSIRYNEIDISCPYVVGACTHPDYRKMGVMNRLLYDTLVKLYNEDILITALYPFKHSFYEKQGFVTVSYANKSQIIFEPELNYLSRDANRSDIHEMTNLYNNFMSQANIFILRNYENMLNRYKETQTTGKTKLVYSASNLIGYIMYDKEEIIEAIGFGFNVIKELDNRYYDTYDIPFNKSVMLRIIKPVELLETINYPKELMTQINLKITDNFFNFNNITFSLQINQSKAKVSKADNYDYCLTIEELTQLVFGSYENNNYNPQSILKELFPIKKTILTDKY